MPKVEIPPQAWECFCGCYFNHFQPTITMAYRVTQREAFRNGWGELPSLATFKRRLKAVPAAERIARTERGMGTQLLKAAEQRRLMRLNEKMQEVSHAN